MHFGVNHIGLFLLTNLLIPLIRTAATTSRKGATRIVNLTSAGHRLSPIRFSDYNFSIKEIPLDERPPAGLPLSVFNPEKGFSTFVAYAQSKTGNILFSVALEKRLSGGGIRSFAVHPGCKSFFTVCNKI
jgi:NAD(P)-dependent dehydrogenase (short-subunit alcohol dehydrogenase family)